MKDNLDKETSCKSLNRKPSKLQPGYIDGLQGLADKQTLRDRKPLKEVNAKEEILQPNLNVNSRGVMKMQMPGPNFDPVGKQSFQNSPMPTKTNSMAYQETGAAHKSIRTIQNMKS